MNKKKIKRTSQLLIVFLSIMISANTQAAIVFRKADSPYYFTEDYIVSNQDTIIIEAGVTIILSPAVNLITNGVIMVNGTVEDSVFFLPKVKGVGWGIISINCPNKVSRLQYAQIVDGRIFSAYCDIFADHLTFYNNQPNLIWNSALLYVQHASAQLENSSVYGDYKGEGFVMENSETALVKNCFFSKIPDAVELMNVTGGYISHNWFEDTPDDAIDLNNCTNTLIDSNIIINAADRGIEIGSESFGNSENIVVKRNILIGCNNGIIFKEDSYGQVINNTFYANNVGVRCIENNAPKSGSFVNIQNCIFSNSVENDVFHDLNSIVNIEYCLSDKENLPGENNLLSNPLFINAVEYNFNLQKNSPCINSGNPGLPLDPDNTVSDMGACYYNTDTTGIHGQEAIFQSLKIYPNPFKDDFVVSWQSTSKKQVHVKLYDLHGIQMPIIFKKDQSGPEITVKVNPVNELGSNTILICKILFNGHSTSYLLIHK